MSDVKKKMDDLTKALQEDLYYDYDEFRQRALRESAQDYYFNEGHESGKIEGKIEGERNRNIEIAKSMLNKNYSFDEITELTGLSEEEIEELKEK